MYLTLWHLGRLVRDSSAVAAVEFALILPLLITLYFGTVEAATLYTVDRRVATVASTMADLVSREKGSISKSQRFDSYFQAATAILQPYPTTGLKQVVSLLSVSATGVAKVVWSYAPSGSTARTGGADFPLPASKHINQLARTNGYLVVAEISYPYKPVFGLVISNAIGLAHTEYYLPRYEERIDLVN